MGASVVNCWLSSGAALAVASEPDYYRLAAHIDATGQSNGTSYTADESRHAHVITYNGNAQITSEKFEFDGTGDFIELAHSLLWVPGSMFTLEVFKLVIDTTTGDQGIISYYSADSGAICWHLVVASGTLSFRWSSTTTSTDNTLNAMSLSTATEYNIAVCWNGLTVFVLVDGIVRASASYSGRFGAPASANATLRLGALANAGVEEEFLDGRFSTVIFTKGECLYSDALDYAVPSLPRSINTPSLTDAHWAKVIWLVSYDETLGKIRDYGPLDLPMSLNGNVAGNATGSVSSSVNTIDFDGTGDFLSMIDDTLTRLQDGQDFCFDAVCKITSTSHISTIANKRASGIARDASLSIDGSQKVALAAWNSSNSLLFNAVGATSVSNNTDAHVAGSLSGTSARVFLNGTQDGTATKSGTIANTTDPRLLGRDGSNTGRDFQGQWAWMRFTKGHARFTASFTAPDGTLPIG
jgi:hypothetical protein